LQRSRRSRELHCAATSALIFASHRCALKLHRASSAHAPLRRHALNVCPDGEKMKLLALLSVAQEEIYHSFVANFSPSRKWQ
jgi:hypothetical protein